MIMGGYQVATAGIWGCKSVANYVALWRGCGLREDVILRTMLFWIDGL